MSISEITDQNAIEQAIEEFDRLSRTEFLRRYGFGPSRTYFLVRDGRRYDSKAILGVAHKFQFPDQGPLGPHDFSGGEAATAPKLRSLGFDVVRERDGDPTSKAEERRYWTLVANPRIYDVDAALAAGAVNSWSSRKAPMRPGDGVILWRTRGQDGKRGIVAIGTVVGEEFHSSDEDDPFWLVTEAAKEIEARIPLRLDYTTGLPLWADGPHRALIESLAAARARGGTVFHLTAAQWTKIVALAGIASPESGGAIDDLASSIRRRGGQGWGLSAAERRAVELHAMELATAHYAERWDVVEDVSRNSCYDLECRSGSHVLHVEVKGTTEFGTAVLLTANEVDHARTHAPHVAMFLVSAIKLHRHPDSEPVASGGRVRILEPWDVDACKLRPLTYQCILP